MNVASLQETHKHYYAVFGKNTDMSLGQYLKKLMKSRNVGTSEMADYCGVTPSAVSSWFRTGKISKENLALVAKRLGVSEGEIIAGQSKPLMPLAERVIEAQIPNDLSLLVKWVDGIKDPVKRDQVIQECMQAFLDATRVKQSQPIVGNDDADQLETRAAAPRLSQDH